MNPIPWSTEAGHHAHLGEVEAHAGVNGNILADVAAKKVVTQRIIDAGGILNDIPNADLAAAGIDSTCDASSNAHEQHEWLVHPFSEHEGVDEKEPLKMEDLPKDGRCPEGLGQEERESLAHLAPKCHPQIHQAPDACQHGTVNDKWPARNLTTSLSKALRKSY